MQSTALYMPTKMPGLFTFWGYLAAQEGCGRSCMRCGPIKALHIEKGFSLGPKKVDISKWDIFVFLHSGTFIHKKNFCFGSHLTVGCSSRRHGTCGQTLKTQSFSCFFCNFSESVHLLGKVSKFQFMYFWFWKKNYFSV